MNSNKIDELSIIPQQKTAKTTNNNYCVSYNQLLATQHSWPQTQNWLSVTC
jgi:hypothetical protein